MVDESSSIPLHHVIIHPEHLAADCEVLVRNIEILRDSTNKSGQWAFRKTKFTLEERRLLLAEAIKIGVMVAFQNHLYSLWEKLRYLQQDGAPIRLRVSCAVARLVMNMWDRKLLTVLNTNGLRIETAFQYMDDKRIILQALALGSRWDRGQIRFRSR